MEEQLKLDLLRADIDNKRTDTAWKATQMRYELAKVAAAYLVGIAAVAGIIVGVGRLMPPPQPQVIFPPGTTITVPR